MLNEKKGKRKKMRKKLHIAIRF